MIEKLVADMSFKLLEKEYVKRAKKRDEGGLAAREYEIYLTALVERILELCGQGQQEPGGIREETPHPVDSVPQGVKPARKRRTKAEMQAVKGGAKSLEAPNGPAKGHEVIPRGKQIPPWVAMRDEVLELCKSHKEPAFIHYFDETFPVNDIHDWLRDSGSKWGVEKIDPLSMKLADGMSKVASKGESDTEAEVKASDKWTVYFRRG
jgi:hypothetical protein